MTFRELNPGEELLHAISYMGFETPTLIQEQVIPEILGSRDIRVSPISFLPDRLP